MNNYDYAKSVYDFKFRHLRNEPDFMSVLKERIESRLKELNELLADVDCSECPHLNTIECFFDASGEACDYTLEAMIHEAQFKTEVYALLKRGSSLTEDQVLALKDADYEEWRREAFNAEYKALEEEYVDVKHLLRWLEENGM